MHNIVKINSLARFQGTHAIDLFCKHTDVIKFHIKMKS